MHSPNSSQRFMERHNSLGQIVEERGEGAARVDCDAVWPAEPGAGADAVVGASIAAAGEGGGLPGADVDTADAVVVTILRCIGHVHAERGASRDAAVWQRAAPHRQGAV